MNLTKLPDYWWKALPYFQLSGSETKVHVLAVLRRKIDGTPTFLEPINLHLQTLRKHVERLINNYFGEHIHPSNWFPFVSKSIEWGQGGYGAFNVFLPTTGTQLDAYPLLGVQDVYYEYDVTNGGEGKLTLFIPDKVLAESTLYMLQNAAITGDYVVQVFTPFLNASPSQADWVISTDLIVGDIGDVNVTQWPFKIEITFGDISGVKINNNEKKRVYADKARKVFVDMAKDIGIGIIWLPWPAGPPQLDTKIIVDVGERSIRDTLFTYFKLLNLRWRVLRSPGLGVPAIIIVWDNSGGNDPYSTFFAKSKAPEAIDFEKAFKDIGKLLTEYIPYARQVFSSLGIYTHGVYNLLIPYYTDPEEMKWVAKRYSHTAHGGLLSTIEAFAASAKLPTAENDIGFWRDLAKRVASAMDAISFSHTKFNIVPIKDIQSFKFVNPQAEIVKQIATTFPGGVTNLKIEKVSAAVAAKKLRAKKINGKYVFVGAGGVEADPNDYVYLVYDPQDSSGGVRVFPAGVKIPGMNNPEGGMPEVYPYRLVVDGMPQFGAWPGFPTYIAGFPPLDGGWETHRIRIELSPFTQRQTLFLRSDRMPLYAKLGG